MAKGDLTVLVVDDMMTMRKIVKKCLIEIGFNQEKILEADDGRPALETLKKQKINLIVCDWNMPNMTGIDLLKAIRTDANLAKTPFLFVTAEAEKTNVLEALKAGADNYIVKPFTPALLQEKLDVISKKYQLY